MALLPTNRKRKALTKEAPAAVDQAAIVDDLVLNGDLNGILSGSEGLSEDDASEDESDFSGAEELGSSAGEADDDSEDLESDEIPSEDDEQDIREQIRQLNTNGTDAKPTMLDTRQSADGDADGLLDEDRSDEETFSLRNYTVTQDANGNPRYIYKEIDPAYDSDDSDAPQTTNTIGDIPLSYYEAYPHIGYDINGKKIMRPAKGEALDALLDSIDVPEGWTGLTDPATGKPLQLSKDELNVLRRLTRNEAPGDGYDPYPEMVEWFTSKQEIMPLSAAPEPKRRFIPSKHEAKRVMKMVRAIKEGRIQPYKPPEERQEEDLNVKRYDIWADEAPRPDHAMNMPAPKLPPPGYNESYHPPPEYLPDQNEKQMWEEADEEDRDREFLPADHTALRKVPGYARFIKEKFERCLDLYLAPRVRRSKLNIDPESLLPKLPSPDELRPFPTVCATLYRGHQGRVRTVSVDPSGSYLASGGDDGTVRIWELLSGRQLWSVKLSSEETVNAIRWRPSREGMILAAAAGETIYFIVPLSLCSPDMETSSRTILDAGFGYATTSASTTIQGTQKAPAATWTRPTSKLVDQGVLLSCTVRALSLIHI